MWIHVAWLQNELVWSRSHIQHDLFLEIFFVNKKNMLHFQNSSCCVTVHKSYSTILKWISKHLLSQKIHGIHLVTDISKVHASYNIFKMQKAQTCLLLFLWWVVSLEMTNSHAPHTLAVSFAGNSIAVADFSLSIWGDSLWLFTQ